MSRIASRIAHLCLNLLVPVSSLLLLLLFFPLTSLCDATDQLDIALMLPRNRNAPAFVVVVISSLSKLSGVVHIVLGNGRERFLSRF